MNDQRSHCPAPRGLLKFVRPPAVVRQRLPLEKFRIVRNRLVDKQQRYLTFQVVALVIVPLVFRCSYSITDENHRRIHIRRLHLALVAGYKIVQIFQRHRLPACGHESECGSRQRFHAHHWHALKVGPCVGSRFQSVAFELRGNVVRSRVASLLSRAAPLERVARQVLHMLANLFRIDPGRRFFPRGTADRNLGEAGKREQRG